VKSIAAALVLAFAIFNASAQPLPHASASFYRIGAVSDIKVHPHAGYALMGGGTDLDEAFHWLCDHADGGDFVVLRASGDDAYNSYVNGLCKLNSVTTIVIPDQEAASEPRVAETIRNASAIFISGGDQSKYTRFWRGTPVEAELRDAVKRGIPIGGTSAGLAVLGQYIYSAEGDRPNDADLTSDAALADPFYRQVVISPDLLGIPILKGIITDSHFDTRQREGRLLVFMARILQSGQAAQIRGIGVDEKTALLVEPDGRAQVVGKGKADFFEASGRPRQCQPGNPLLFEWVREQRASHGEAFNLNSWQGSGRIYLVSVLNANGKPVIATTPGPWSSPSR
jgi:cyanophycinase